MIKNALNCSSDFLGSGQRNCVIESLGDMLGFALLSVGNNTKWNNNSPLSRQGYLDLLKGLKAFPYLTRYEFVDNTPDNEINTSSVGVIRPIRQGKPLYQFVYTKGTCTYKSIYNKIGLQWQVALIFETGVLLTETVDGNVRGFNASPLNVETYRFQSGTDLERSIVNIQLLYPDELNKSSVFYTWEALGFDLREINGVVDVNIEAVGSPGGSNEIEVKVTTSCNGSDVVLGLDDENIWSISSGQTVTSVSYDANTKTYTLTLSGNLPTSGTAILKLSESGFDVVEDAAGELLKGKTTINLSAPSA